MTSPILSGPSTVGTKGALPHHKLPLCNDLTYYFWPQYHTFPYRRDPGSPHHELPISSSPPFSGPSTVGINGALSTSCLSFQ